MPSDPQFRPHPIRRRKTSHEPPPTVKLNRPNAPSGKLSLIAKIKLAIQIKNLINQAKTMKLSGSWRTSLFGVGGLATILVNIASMLMDGDPATNPDWSVTLPAIITAAALLFAKDAKVSNAAHPMAEAKSVD